MSTVDCIDAESIKHPASPSALFDDRACVGYIAHCSIGIVGFGSGGFVLVHEDLRPQSARCLRFEDAIGCFEMRSVCFTSSRWTACFQRSGDATAAPSRNLKLPSTSRSRGRNRALLLRLDFSEYRGPSCGPGAVHFGIRQVDQPLHCFTQSLRSNCNRDLCLLFSQFTESGHQQLFGCVRFALFQY